jgi:hypothetical protein
MGSVSWVAVALLACAVAIVLAAEWPRLSERLGLEARRPRARRRRKQKQRLRVVPTETDDFAESVRRDLENLPTIEERDQRRY